MSVYKCIFLPRYVVGMYLSNGESSVSFFLSFFFFLLRGS